MNLKKYQLALGAGMDGPADAYLATYQVALFLRRRHNTRCLTWQEQDTQEVMTAMYECPLAERCWRSAGKSSLHKGRMWCNGNTPTKRKQYLQNVGNLFRQPLADAGFESLPSYWFGTVQGTEQITSSAMLGSSPRVPVGSPLTVY